MQQKVPLEELNASEQHWHYYVVIGGTLLITVALMTIGPGLIGEDYAALALVAFELVVVLGGFLWFILLKVKKSDPRRED